MNNIISDLGFRISDLTRPPSSTRPRRAIHRRPYGLRSPGSPARGAFTLIEMLVAVGLVVLMMTLFATIFQMATSAMSTQKGLAENDQKVRVVLTRLRNDLNGKSQGQDTNDPNRPYRTFRNLVPFGADEQAPVGGFVDRNGYFYISENDPNDDTDDVLALTVQFPNGSSDQFFGRAAIVFPDTTAAASYGTPAPGNGPGPPNPNFPAAQANYPVGGVFASTTAGNSYAALPQAGQQYWPNQPEFDDVQGTPNGVGDSQFAEVCYFLRRGTLYRRVMLIRQPNISGLKAQDGTPTDTGYTGTPVALNVASLTIPSTYGMNAKRNFLTDFDYSTSFDSALRQTGSAVILGLRFHGTGSQSIIVNDSLAPINAGLTIWDPPTSPQWAPPFNLGNPAYRFGFDSSVQTVTVNGNSAVVPSATYGQPREFISTGGLGVPANSTFFIGRFTHAETSDPTFQYPGNLNGASGNPMNLATNLNFNTTTGAVSNYPNGPRGGEDVLMTNVLKFDIKVFDPAASVGPDGAYGVANFDDDNNGTPDDISELGWPGSDDGDFRDLGHLGQTGFYASSGSAMVADFDGVAAKQQRIVGPTNTPVTSRVAIPSSYTEPGGTATGTATYNSFFKRSYPNSNYNYGIATANSPPLAPFANRYDTWGPSVSLTNTTDGTGSVAGVTGNVIYESPPFRPFTFGPDKRPGTAFTDDDGNGKTDYVVDPATGLLVPDPREIGWPGTDDVPSALSAIQIKITFYDRTTKQVRETTLVQSLIYKP